MKRKQALLDCLLKEQLKDICEELEVEADRRSQEAMVAALASSKRAKVERLIEWMTVEQLKNALELMELPVGGRKEELVERLLGSDGKAAAALAVGRPSNGNKGGSMSEKTEQYRHANQAVQRPDAGVQDQFQGRKPPKTYRYDSSLDPAMSWDESRERELGEWLLGLIERSATAGEKSVFASPQVWKGGGVQVKSLAGAFSLLKSLTKPFLNWAGKSERHEISVPTVPLFVHERHSTKAILDGIRERKAKGTSLDLFGDPQLDIRDKLEAYEHKGPWQNRMILGDSLPVMNSLLEFEGLGGQVQMIFIDPPYGVKFGSNFQPFVRKREVKNASDDDMTREPEMVRAYRDTWELGLHSYLTYLRDRLLVARELLHESGSVFVQISDDNLHHVREVMDEVFGQDNFCQIIGFRKTGGQSSTLLASISDYLLMYARNLEQLKYRPLFADKVPGQEGATNYTWIEERDGTRRPLTAAEKTTWELPRDAKILQPYPMFSDGESPHDKPFQWHGETYRPASNNHWKTTAEGLARLASVNRLVAQGKTLRYVNYLSDYPVTPLTNYWADTQISGFGEAKLYVVQTLPKVVARALLMTTDPGDLVLDPTCGSGTTAYVAEQWGRRWITIDTSRVPLALARQRLLTATYPYYELKDPQRGPAGGFTYKRKQNKKGEEIGGLVPHITLKSIANDEQAAMEVLVDRPEELSKVTRVSGPFVVEATVAPSQSIGTDENGDKVAASGDAATHLERMTVVLRQSRTLQLPGNRELRLDGIRRTVDAEYLHAEATEGESKNRVAIVFGPEDGAISSDIVYEAAREAHYLKYDRLYFFGFAIQAKARELLEDAKKLRIPATYVAVTPDVAMSDLLKTSRASEIFSVTGLPDIDVTKSKKKGSTGEELWQVELNGLDVFDPATLEQESIEGQSVPAWMLDTDYDGMSFYATQVFFPRTSAWDNLQKSLGATFDESVWAHLAGTVSEPFALGKRKRIAVKVIDERGNELMRVKDVAE